MSDFLFHRRKGYVELRPYVLGENMNEISVSSEDEKNGSPKKGDMIARNPFNKKDQWLVNKEYYEENYELVKFR